MAPLRDTRNYDLVTENFDPAVAQDVDQNAGNNHVLQVSNGFDLLDQWHQLQSIHQQLQSDQSHFILHLLDQLIDHIQLAHLQTQGMCNQSLLAGNRSLNLGEYVKP